MGFGVYCIGICMGRCIGGDRVYGDGAGPSPCPGPGTGAVPGGGTMNGMNGGVGCIGGVDIPGPGSGSEPT